jgi:hypothetical protein
MVAELWWIEFGVENFYKGCGGNYYAGGGIIIFRYYFLCRKMGEVEKNKHDKNPFLKLNSKH